MTIVRCLADCVHCDGGFCVAESINLIDKEYYNEVGEQAWDEMSCITFKRGNRHAKPIQTLNQLPRNSVFTRR